MEALNQAPEAPTEVSNTLQDIRILSKEVGATDIDGDILTMLGACRSWNPQCRYKRSMELFSSRWVWLGTDRRYHHHR